MAHSLKAISAIAAVSLSLLLTGCGDDDTTAPATTTTATPTTTVPSTSPELPTTEPAPADVLPPATEFTAPEPAPNPAPAPAQEAPVEQEPEPAQVEQTPPVLPDPGFEPRPGY